MNYYEHHIGDYAKATSHLTFVEDAAYSRLMRRYYDSERPLPADLPTLQRLVGARTREEKNSVKTVLEEFFFLEADGWHNKRADEEIARYHEKSAKARQSANARWMRSHNDRTADAEQTQSESNALHTPVTIHQTPIKEREAKPARVARATQLPDDFQISESGVKYAQMKYVDVKVEFEAFKNYHTANGTTLKNWDAGWRTWCDRAAKYNKARINQPLKTEHQIRQDATAKAIFGTLSPNRIIDVEASHAENATPRLG